MPALQQLGHSWSPVICALRPIGRGVEKADLQLGAAEPIRNNVYNSHGEAEDPRSYLAGWEMPSPVPIVPSHTAAQAALPSEVVVGMLN